LIGADETGAKINGILSWFWTWQTPKATLITASNNRGFETIEHNFKDGFPQSKIIIYICNQKNINLTITFL